MFDGDILMKESSIIFGKIFRYHRLKNRLTQEKLSELSYINIKTISDIENGKYNIDIDKLEIFSNLLKVDLVEEYLNIFLEDSKIIDSIIDNLNSKDNVAGFSYADEIETLFQIENNTFRKLIRIKAKKLRLFFENMQIKDDKEKRKAIIIEALNTGKAFDFSNLDSNTYDSLDCRLLMNYTQIMDSYDDKLKLLLFLENLKLNDTNFNSILFHNIAVSYYNLDESKIALDYINKAIDLNSKKRSSPIMLYMKSIILYDLSLEYKEVSQLAIEEAKKTDENLYSLIMKKYKRKSQYQKNFEMP